MKNRLVSFLFVFSLCAWGQQSELANRQLNLPVIRAYTVAGLPVAGTPGLLAIVTNSTAAGDCTVGGGTAITLCRDSGAAWEALGGTGAGGPPTGAAGGDLGGSYPNPDVVKVQSKAVTLTGIAAGDTLIYDGVGFVDGKITQANTKPGNVKKSSASVLLINDGCSSGDPCNIASAGTVYSFTGSATATIIAGAGGGIAQIYMTPAGTLVVSHASAAGLTVTCTGCTGLQTASPSVPPGATWLYYVTVVAGEWGVVTDKRQFLSAGSSWTEYAQLPAAICQSATASTGFSLPAANAPSAACSTGTYTQLGKLSFDETTDESIQTHFPLPEDWTGDLSLRLRWFGAATTGNVVWGVETACAAPGATVDQAWNTAQTVISQVAGVTNQLVDASISPLTTTGCTGVADSYSWSYVGVGTASSIDEALGDMTPGLPAGIEAGDLLFALAGTRDGAEAFGMSAAWTSLGAPSQANMGMQVFWHRYDGATSPSTNITFTGLPKRVSRIVAVRGAILSGSPINTSAGSLDSNASPTNPITVSSVTTTVANTYHLVFYGKNVSGTPTLSMSTEPNPLLGDDLWISEVAAGTNRVAISFFTPGVKTNGTGATGTRSITPTNADFQNALHVALSPATESTTVSELFVKVYRDADDSNDNMTGDADLAGVRLGVGRQR